MEQSIKVGHNTFLPLIRLKKGIIKKTMKTLLLFLLLIGLALPAWGRTDHGRDGDDTQDLLDEFFADGFGFDFERFWQMFEDPAGAKPKVQDNLTPGGMAFSETERQYILSINLGEKGNEQVDVSVNRGLLTITRSQRSQSQRSVLGLSGTSQSFSSSTQTLPLPEDADPDSLATERRDNKLVVTIDKQGTGTMDPATKPPQNNAAEDTSKGDSKQQDKHKIETL